MYKIDETVNMVNTMETIALEASVLANMVSTVKRMFPALIDGAKAAFSKVEDLPEITIVSTPKQEETIRKIANVSFMDLDTFSVTVPEGFNATYLEALEVCELGIEYIHFVKNNLLKEFRVYLSVFISNKDSKISTKDITFKFKEYQKKKDLVNEAFAKLYKDNSFEATAKLPDVLKRNADLKTVVERFNAITKQLNGIEPEAIKQEVADIVELIEVISSQAERDKIENISPEAIKNIADGAYECAKQVETVAACYFRVMTILKSIDGFIEKLSVRVA